MSEILIGSNPSNPQVIGVFSSEATAEEKANQLPVPSGWRILCAIPEMDANYASGIAKADETKRIEETLTTVLFVVALGPDCYTDTTRYPSGPWCKKGDFVLKQNHHLIMTIQMTYMSHFAIISLNIIVTAK